MLRIHKVEQGWRTEQINGDECFGNDVNSNRASMFRNCAALLFREIERERERK